VEYLIIETHDKEGYKCLGDMVMVQDVVVVSAVAAVVAAAVASFGLL
jgi:hypothetical protein